MAYVDARGVQEDYSIGSSVGIYRQYTAYDENGAVYDLTNKTLHVVLEDDRTPAASYGSEFGSSVTLTLTITDAANGQFDFIIPPSEFANRQGGRMSYQIRIASNTTTGLIGLMWGYINIQEKG